MEMVPSTRTSKISVFQANSAFSSPPLLTKICKGSVCGIRRTAKVSGLGYRVLRGLFMTLRPKNMEIKQKRSLSHCQFSAGGHSLTILGHLLEIQCRPALEPVTAEIILQPLAIRCELLEQAVS